MATANKPTLQEVVFNDLNYETWAPIMKATLVERGLWDVVENVSPPNPLSMPELAATIQAEDLSPWRDFVVKDTKAIHILQCSLPDSVFRQTLVDIGPRTYYDDMWMIYTTTSNHMSPHEKYFTSLDRTHKARIRSITGKSIMSEGLGDVAMVTDKGKTKMIKNVLFVPKIGRNILSAGQLTEDGYGIIMSAHKCTITDQNERLFGEAMWEERGVYLVL